MENFIEKLVNIYLEHLSSQNFFSFFFRIFKEILKKIIKNGFERSKCKTFRRKRNAPIRPWDMGKSSLLIISHYESLESLR